MRLPVANPLGRYGRSGDHPSAGTGHCREVVSRWKRLVATIGKGWSPFVGYKSTPERKAGVSVPPVHSETYRLQLREW